MQRELRRFKTLLNRIRIPGGTLLNQITCVGYTCPICKRRVTVLRSSAPPVKAPADYLESECECGFALKIGLEQVQLLDTWKEAGRVL